jgi:probable H4MPT-linked C1 transfer pathway protein
VIRFIVSSPASVVQVFNLGSPPGGVKYRPIGFVRRGAGYIRAMEATELLALDVGGANLKVADGRGYAVTEAFALWRQPQHLAEALRRLLHLGPRVRRLVATMTGELADCFRTKSEGVRAIVQALVEAAEERELAIYLTDGSLVHPEEAIRRPLEAAASNWHVLARFAARYLPLEQAEAWTPTGLLIDIGSTTCDLIPIRDGRPVTRGKTDPERLAAGELVYTGVVRSPICAVVSEIPWRGGVCPVAQEVFATTLDAYLLLGDLPEGPDNLQTADGRPATRELARERLARMICADREMLDQRDALAAARAIDEAQVQKIAQALRDVQRRLPAALGAVVISGQGEFLARRVLQHVGFSGRIVSLGEQLGPGISQAAPAHALAVLAQLE